MHSVDNRTFSPFTFSPALRLDSNRSAGIRAWLIYYRGVNIARIHIDVFAIKFDHDCAISLEGGGSAVD